MRILHVILTPRFSGAEILVRDLSAVHHQSGHVIAVAALNPAEFDFQPVIQSSRERGIDWYIPEVRLGRWRRVKFLKEIIRKFAPDVVLAHSVIPAAYARLAEKKRVISVLHSETNYDSVYLSLSERLLQRRTLGVVAVSPLAAEQYRSRFSHPCIAVVPNGISLPKIRNAERKRQYHRSQFALGSAAYVVLQVGRIIDVKRQHLTLRALHPLLEANRAVQIWFAGLVEDMQYQRELFSWAQRHGLSQQIKFLGPREDIPELMSLADLIVMPSAREAQSIALIEALASGCPIVASSIKSFLYAKNYEGVTLLDPENLFEFGKAAASALEKTKRHARHVNEYDIAETANNYIKFIKEALPSG